HQIVLNTCSSSSSLRRSPPRSFFFLMTRPPPRSPLFPYTTLFRSVAFAGTAFLQCPLTIDDTAFRQSVEALDVNIIPQGGTALAEAIDTALAAFKEGESYKALVLLTDGEDHDSGALEAAKRAAQAGLQIFTVGVGTTDGELLRIKDVNGKSDFVRDEQGNVVKSHLN